MEEALRADLLTLLQAPSARNADRQKHCKYHQNLGHDTEDYDTLKDKLEELVREGHLKRYVQEEKSREVPRKNHPRQNNQQSGGGGATSSARKRHLRNLRSVNQADVRRRSMPRIIFSDEDFHAPDPIQDDPMVITAVIAQYTGAKVLIDQGSSANIILEDLPVNEPIGRYHSSV
ncbi:uncharacterized protein LOC108327332 [Vigna angularis]|uniref:uncharacterized protein LOC108327332 n=1 Tax=Phaseolus angularis TaxID=3914 RepID=UPI00080A1940|nr:uncharacterized protein LOC108327332 [Vigna angularis]